MKFASLTVWNMKAWKPMTVLPLGEDPPAITSLSFNHNGKILAAAATDGMIHIFAKDMSTGFQITGWPAHDSAISSVVFGHDETSIFGLGSDGKASTCLLVLRSANCHPYLNVLVHLWLPLRYWEVVMTRSKVSIRIEGKEFLIEHWSNARPEEEVTEKTKRKTFTGLVSAAGARWIGKLLSQLGRSAIATSTAFAFDDRHFRIKATVRANQRGVFLHTLVSLIRKDLRAFCLCFPTGGNNLSWSLLGDNINDLLPFRRSIVQVQGISDGNDARIRKDLTFAEVCSKNTQSSSE
ncbi:hypothetical protein FRX31_032779 [Thalictrum thalictroides]|uniref:Uncharacterized protein n=1 Tax=Thalictrum thalictroides TaxID=46969 RepID=A0A7J6UYB9_THATH|nr:hypothetical protein FRX31_032779 [Thalictrum thalictroides]